MDNKYFTQALSDFMFDAASGGAIRHLADQGYSVREIAEKIAFPTPMVKIQEIVWKRLIETGVIFLENPDEIRGTEKISYVKDYSSTGKTSFRRVKEMVEKPKGDYIACTFGR